MPITLPAPEGTIYIVVPADGVFRSPGRADVPLTGDSPDIPPFLVDRGALVDAGQKLRI
jgi:hypothetical protein